MKSDSLTLEIVKTNIEYMDRENLKNILLKDHFRKVPEKLGLARKHS